MSTIETTIMMNDFGINISQLCIQLIILRYKIGAKLFESETKMTGLCDGMITPQLGKIYIWSRIW